MNARLWTLLSVGLLAAVVLLAGCGTKVTRSNYEKITTGMTLAEVEAILGPGEKEASAAGAIGDVAGSTAIYKWTDGDKTITITFINDKVTNKLATGF